MHSDPKLCSCPLSYSLITKALMKVLQWHHFNKSYSTSTTFHLLQGLLFYLVTVSQLWFWLELLRARGMNLLQSLCLRQLAQAQPGTGFEDIFAQQDLREASQSLSMCHNSRHGYSSKPKSCSIKPVLASAGNQECSRDHTEHLATLNLQLPQVQWEITGIQIFLVFIKPTAHRTLRNLGIQDLYLVAKKKKKKAFFQPQDK